MAYGSGGVDVRSNTPNIPITAPTVVYHNRMPQRSNHPPSGKINGKQMNPTSPKRKPTVFPTATLVSNDGFPNMIRGPLQQPTTNCRFQKVVRVAQSQPFRTLCHLMNLKLSQTVWKVCRRFLQAQLSFVVQVQNR